VIGYEKPAQSQFADFKIGAAKGSMIHIEIGGADLDCQGHL
jgi:hypothetical protein